MKDYMFLYLSRKGKILFWVSFIGTRASLLNYLTMHEVHELSILLPAFIKSKRKVLLAEDFNVNLLKLDVHEPSQDFFNTMTSFYLAPARNSLTRVTPDTDTLIDNFFSQILVKILLILRL